MKNQEHVTPKEILNFWFKETKPEQRFVTNTEFDALIAERFRNIHSQAVRCELFPWRETIQGRLAEIVILDQFSRNIYRNDRRAFAADPLALALSQEAIRTGMQTSLSSEERSFLYMPFMHSESQRIHEFAVKLFSEPGLEQNLNYEIMHKKIIDRFGRFPHRNEILGRVSSFEEREFLKQPNSHF